MLSAPLLTSGVPTLTPGRMFTTVHTCVVLCKYIFSEDLKHVFVYCRCDNRHHVLMTLQVPEGGQVVWRGGGRDEPHHVVPRLLHPPLLGRRQPLVPRPGNTHQLLRIYCDWEWLKYEFQCPPDEDGYRKGSLAMPLTPQHNFVLSHVMGSSLQAASNWSWVGGRYIYAYCVAQSRSSPEGFNDPDILDMFDSGHAVKYNHRAYSMHFMASWFFVNKQKIFQGEVDMCMWPEYYPRIDCKFMEMFFFEAGSSPNGANVSNTKDGKKLDLKVWVCRRGGAVELVVRRAEGWQLLLALLRGQLPGGAGGQVPLRHRRLEERALQARAALPLPVPGKPVSDVWRLFIYTMIWLWLDNNQSELPPRTRNFSTSCL